MVKSKNIIAGLGVVAGLGVAMLPLGAFAAQEGTDSKVIRATVAEEFILTVTSSDTTMTETGAGTVALTRGGTAVDTLTHTVNVNGNLYKGYDLYMYGSGVSATDLVFVADSSKDFGAADRYSTATKISTGTTLSGNTSAWAYKKTEATSGTPAAPDYSGVDWTTIKAEASKDKLKENANSGHVSFNDTVYVNFGIFAASNQAAGVYEGQVTYKATPKV